MKNVEDNVIGIWTARPSQETRLLDLDERVSGE